MHPLRQCLAAGLPQCTAALAGLVGLAVGLVGADGTFRFRGHGQADVTTRRAVTEDTVFRIASITKTLTAFAVMQLVEQGLVELDEPANRYLRELRLVPADPSHRPATVRHRVGVRCFWALRARAGQIRPGS